MGKNELFGAELRKLRQGAGLSLAGLAARTYYSKSYLSKVENGLKPPNTALAAVCETELDAQGALMALVPSSPRRTGSRSTVGVVPSGLPPATTFFVGRTDELRAIRDALGTESATCVVSGFGGVGKTALAIQCAHSFADGFADGCVFVDLGGRGEAAVPPSVVHDRLLRILGVPVERIPADPDDRAAVYRSVLRGRSMLLVLDNAGSAAQVRSLQPGGSKCRVLVTSRSRLAALDDVQHVSVDVLPGTAAAELFAALTGVDAIEEAVASVVERCGRIPLAIRIAAARLRAHPAWDVGEIDRRLADESALFAELDDGERSLAATLRLSVRGLDPAEARLLGLLALHPGADFDVAAAGALGGLGSRETDRILDRLHDAHLIRQSAANRYGFHDLVRAFAGTLTIGRDEDPAALRRMFGYYLSTAAQADRLMTPGRFQVVESSEDEACRDFRSVDDAREWVRSELPTLVALVRLEEHGLDVLRWQLAFTLRGYLYLAKEIDAWLETHVAALTAVRRLGDLRAQAVTRNNLGMGLAAAQRLDEAVEQHTLAYELFERLGDQHGLSDCLANLGAVLARRGRFGEALTHQRKALAYYSGAGLARNTGITLRSMATAYLALGKPGDAVRCAEEALDIAIARDHDMDIAQAANALGAARELEQDRKRAEAAWRRALVHGERCGSAHEQAAAHWGLGRIAATENRFAEAENALLAARELYDRMNSPHAAEVAKLLTALREP